MVVAIFDFAETQCRLGNDVEGNVRSGWILTAFPHQDIRSLLDKSRGGAVTVLLWLEMTIDISPSRNES